MNTSTDITRLAPALLAVHKELGVIGKDAINPAFKSKYATLEAITENVRPILTAHGFALIQGVTPSEKGITVYTRLLHETGEWIECSVPVPLEKPTAQGAGSAVTYGRRYSLSAILALSVDDDDDGNAAEKQRKTVPQRSAPPAQATNATLATRSERIDFGKQWKGKTVADLALKDLEWAAGEGAQFIPARWKAVFAGELETKRDQK